MTTNQTPPAVGFILALTLTATLHAATIAVSTFDTTLDGWTVIGSGRLYHQSTGGNPTGFARYDDIAGTGGDGWISAPANFLGDWSSLDRHGALAWDHIILNPGGSPTILRAAAFFSGPAGSATYRSRNYFSFSWQTFSVPINPNHWSVTGSWPDLLANVTFLRLRIEAAHNGGPGLDRDGIDNVTLVPEPCTCAFMIMSAFLLKIATQNKIKPSGAA